MASVIENGAHIVVHVRLVTSRHGGLFMLLSREGRCCGAQGKSSRGG